MLLLLLLLLPTLPNYDAALSFAPCWAAGTAA
jgi:hypothetical protein